MIPSDPSKKIELAALDLIVSLPAEGLVTRLEASDLDGALRRLLRPNAASARQDVLRVESIILPQQNLGVLVYHVIPVLIAIAATRSNLNDIYDLLEAVAICTTSDGCHSVPQIFIRVGDEDVLLSAACAAELTHGHVLFTNDLRDTTLPQDIRLNALSILAKTMNSAELLTLVEPVLASEENSVFLHDAMSFLPHGC